MLAFPKFVVYQVKDTIFWKQITTAFSILLHSFMLFIKSKIQFFESKSQLNQLIHPKPCSCLSSQRYNFLKANHNHKRRVLTHQPVVYQVKDTIFWKQITTRVIKYAINYLLFIKSKIQFFESKSQRKLQRLTITASCLSSQRYNFLKANHNLSTVCPLQIQLFIKSKIQFFESKSQPWYLRSFYQLRCLSSQRYNFLKANHNSCSKWDIVCGVVYQVKDTIFWKQITTLRQSAKEKVISENETGIERER